MAITYGLIRLKILDLDSSVSIDTVDLLLDVDGVLLVAHSQMQLENAALNRAPRRIQIHYLQIRKKRLISG